MRFAYADPPYLGKARKYYRNHPDYAGEVDHAALVEDLSAFDGWALSCSSPSLRLILPLCPNDVRIMAWVKTFSTMFPGVNPAYAWEPVLMRGGRTPPRPTVFDWMSAPSPIVYGGGLVGRKPPEFCRWLFLCLGMQPDDDFTDLFPGSGAVGRTWEAWRSQLALEAVEVES